MLYVTCRKLISKLYNHEAETHETVCEHLHEHPISIMMSLWRNTAT